MLEACALPCWGSNDGIVSSASLIVAAAGADRTSIRLAGTAGLMAGALSMAAGEYVSVKTPEDTERADLKMEGLALANHPEEEAEELAAIYVNRGLDRSLAPELARQPTAQDALTAHARDEIGITDMPECPPSPSRDLVGGGRHLRCRRPRF